MLHRLQRHRKHVTRLCIYATRFFTLHLETIFPLLSTTRRRKFVAARNERERRFCNLEEQTERRIALDGVFGLLCFMCFATAGKER